MRVTSIPTSGPVGPLPRGEVLAELFLGSRDWVHRRVDAITLEANGTTRRAISFDVEVPEILRVTGSKNRTIIPLALIEKGALRRVSTADPAGHPMPVLSAKQNTDLAVELLYALVPSSWVATSPVDTRTMLRQVASAPRAGGTQLEEMRRLGILQALGSWIDSLTVPDEHDAQSDLETLRRLISGFMDHFLLAVQVKDEFLGTRCVLKFAYDRDLLIHGSGTFVADTNLSMPDMGFSRSQHIEFVVPPGLTIPTLAVLVDGEVIADVSETERSTAHVAFQAKGRSSEGNVLVEMKPVEAGIHRFTTIALAAVVTLSLFGFSEKYDFIHLVGDQFQIPSQTVSVLLIGPALFLSWMSRAQEHEAVAILLRPLRVVLFCCTVALFAFAVAAAVPLSGLAWELVWAIAAASVVGAVGTYTAYRLNLLKIVRQAIRLGSNKEG